MVKTDRMVDYMAVFPGYMRRLDTSDPKKSLQILEEYFNYMVEQIEFSDGTMTKKVAAAGISNVEVKQMIEKFSAELSTINSRLGQMQGQVTDVSGQVQALKTTIGTMPEGQSVAQALEDLNTRVETLENKEVT